MPEQSTEKEELQKTPLELFEIKVTPTDEEVNSLEWIRKNPGKKVISFRDVDGKDRQMFYEPKTDDPRYSEVGEEEIELPEHITVVRDKKIGRKLIAKGGDWKKAGSGWWTAMNIPQEGHYAGVEQHPYIATIYDLAVTSAGQIYLIMEYLPNETIQTWAEEPHSIEEVGEIIDKISSALTNIHTKRKLVYADMKPLNIGLDSEFNPKLIDFELAIQLSENGTTVNSYARTYHYAAPEQKGTDFNALTIQTDVYGLAATIFAIFVGTENEFETYCTREEFEKDQIDQIPFREDYLERLSEKQRKKISKVLRKGLSKNPEDRHKSIKEFNQAFQDAIK